MFLHDIPILYYPVKNIIKISTIKLDIWVISTEKTLNRLKKNSWILYNPNKFKIAWNIWELFSFEMAIFEMFLWRFLFGHAELSLVLEHPKRNREAWWLWASLRLSDPSGHSGIHVLPFPSLHEGSPEQACFLPASLRCSSQRTAAAVMAGKSQAPQQ